jgi:NTE family protein
LKARIDYPNRGQFYLEPTATFNSWDYLEGDDLVVTNETPTVLNRIDRKIGAALGVPMGRNYKLSIDGSYINNKDNYINSDVFVSTDTLDQLKVQGIRAGLAFTANSLNRKQYASQGRAYSFSLDWFGVIENYQPGTTSVSTLPTNNYRSWLRAKVSLEQYFKQGLYSAGYVFEYVLSNQPVFSNYMGTVINAPAFNPIQDSKTLLLQNFRAFNYVAGGWRNVFNIRKSLDFRLEGYLFKPLEAIVKSQDQEATLERDFTKVYFAATAGLVLHSSIGPISLNVNYYDDNENQLGVLLHVGFLLFNKTSME